jgi:hypothetical protein
MYVLRTIEAHSDLFILMFPFNSYSSNVSGFDAYKMFYYFRVFSV